MYVLLYSLIGTEFSNKFNAQLFKLMGFEHCVPTVYHLEANGLVEKNKILAIHKP